MNPLAHTLSPFGEGCLKTPRLDIMSLEPYQRLATPLNPIPEIHWGCECGVCLPSYTKLALKGLIPQITTLSKMTSFIGALEEYPLITDRTPAIYSVNKGMFTTLRTKAIVEAVKKSYSTPDVTSLPPSIVINQLDGLFDGNVRTSIVGIPLVFMLMTSDNYTTKQQSLIMNALISADLTAQVHILIHPKNVDIKSAILEIQEVI